MQPIVKMTAENSFISLPFNILVVPSCSMRVSDQRSRYGSKVQTRGGENSRNNEHHGNCACLSQVSVRPRTSIQTMGGGAASRSCRSVVGEFRAQLASIASVQVRWSGWREVILRMRGNRRRPRRGQTNLKYQKRQLKLIDGNLATSESHGTIEGQEHSHLSKEEG